VAQKKLYGEQSGGPNFLKKHDKLRKGVPWWMVWTWNRRWKMSFFHLSHLYLSTTS